MRHSPRTLVAFLSVAFATVVHMRNDLLERRESVDADRIDDVALLEHLASTEPGPFSIMVLAGIDVAALDSDGLLDYAREWDRQQAWATARAQDALAAVLTADLPDDESRIGDELQYRAAMVARPRCIGHRAVHSAASCRRNASLANYPAPTRY